MSVGDQLCFATSGASSTLCGTTTAVFRGTLTDSAWNADAGEYPLPVIIKVVFSQADFDRLEKERRFYEAFSPPEEAVNKGLVVPQFYGIYKTTNPKMAYPFGLIILEDCGSSFASWNDVIAEGPRFRKAVVCGTRNLHKHSLIHVNLIPQHILRSEPEGFPVFISFSQTEEKACPRHADKHSPVLGDLEPIADVFECLEEWTLCRDLEIWRPRTIDFCGQPYFVDAYLNNVQGLIHSAQYGGPADVFEHACKVVRDYIAKYLPDFESPLKALDDKEIEKLGKEWGDVVEQFLVDLSKDAGRERKVSWLAVDVRALPALPAELGPQPSVL
ncbi:hypothetical protein PENSPDRAFT_649827 [Peniophora sp. CONT]|nr:hypothetical protein PENSPDRAFT_649827 [Peniophora sp. CONT]